MRSEGTSESVTEGNTGGKARVEVGSKEREVTPEKAVKALGDEVNDCDDSFVGIESSVDGIEDINIDG